MICPQCGRELPGDSNFCPSCDGTGTIVRPSSLKANWTAVASLAVGIFSLFSMFELLPELLAIVLGVSSRKKCDRQWIATAGIVCGVISLGLTLFTVLLFGQWAPPSMP